MGWKKEIGKTTPQNVIPLIWSLLTIPEHTVIFDKINDKAAQCNSFVRQKNLGLLISKGVLAIQKPLYLKHYLVNLSLIQPKKRVVCKS